MATSMQVWLDQRSVKLLQDLSDVPFTDDHDARRLGLIKKALRDAASELVRRSVQKQMADMVSAQAMDVLEPPAA